MPFRSRAQQRYMHAAAARGEIPRGTVREWDRETERKRGGFEALPEKVRKKKMRTQKEARMLLEKSALSGGHDDWPPWLRELYRDNRNLLRSARDIRKWQTLLSRNPTFKDVAKDLYSNPRVRRLAYSAGGAAIGGGGLAAGIGAIKSRLAPSPAKGLKLLMKRNPLGAALGAVGVGAVGASLLSRNKNASIPSVEDSAFSATLAELLLKQAMTTDYELQNAFYPHRAASLLERTNPNDADELPDFTSASQMLARESDVTARLLLPRSARAISTNRQEMRARLRHFNEARKGSTALR